MTRFQTKCRQCEQPTTKHYANYHTWLCKACFESQAQEQAPPQPAPMPLKLSLADWRVGDQYACIGNGLFVRTRARKNRSR